MPVVGSDPHLKESETLCNEEAQKAVSRLKVPSISALQGPGAWEALAVVALSYLCSAEKM